MDSSFREQGSGTRRDSKGFFSILKIFAGLIHWLAGLVSLTAEEQEEAGIYLGRPGPGGE
jgi:hypothetical protein